MFNWKQDIFWLCVAIIIAIIGGTIISSVSHIAAVIIIGLSGFYSFVFVVDILIKIHDYLGD